jgi:hypothetical protein
MREYESLADLLRDFKNENSEVARQAATAEFLVPWVMAFIEDYFGEPVAGAA